jgi:RHS repeat-associated protein
MKTKIIRSVQHQSTYGYKFHKTRKAMSKKLLMFIAILLPFIVLGQSTDQNFVETTVYRDSLAERPVHTITYFDGLGRPIQKIAGRQSGTGTDIITHMEYDIYGRQQREYLPIIDGQSLNYRTIDNSAVTNYYGTPAFPDMATTANPYSEKLFEASPLNRVLKQAAPGDDWAMGQGHEVKFDYQVNDSIEVRLYKAAITWDSTTGVYQPTLSNNGFYPKNQLYKTITRDENWSTGTNHTTEEFKDREGRVVLKRNYNNSIAHETYYVYDDFGNLTFVIPPMVNTLHAITQLKLDDMCYQYKYDDRNRLAEKKLPGKQWEFIAYNSQGMPIATGPVLNPFGGSGEGWLITKYDVYGRVAYTGWTQAVHLQDKNRKDFEYNLSAVNWSEHSTTTAVTIDGLAVKYSNNTSPTSFKLLTVNYYDNYGFPGMQEIEPGIEGLDLLKESKSLPVATWVRVLENPANITGNLSVILYDNKGRPVINRNFNYLGGYTQTDSALDFAGKTGYTITKHKRVDANQELAILDDYKYNDQDRPTIHSHKINELPLQTLVSNTYDELGQLGSKDVGNDAIGALQKVNFKYNIRGWLTQINDVDSLQIDSDPQDLFAFKINYSEPIENDANATIKPLYNGNIAETNWRTCTDNIVRRYGYTYDELNRLTNSVYQKPGLGNPVTDMYNERMTYDKNGNIQTMNRNGDFDSNTLGEIEIDDLSYVYDSNKKNLLLKVTDGTNSPKGFKDGINTQNDYGYDQYGNMERDENKNITAIVYNHLNLPTRITFGTGNKIEYLYDAIGQKLQKRVYYGAECITTDYLDGFQYVNEELNFFPHAEGYVNVTRCNECEDPTQLIFNYVYQYKDHLGNIRVNYGYDDTEETLKILEENHYYPFGLKHTQYNVDGKVYEPSEENPSVTQIKDLPLGEELLYKYKYNGKEYQDELGLNLYDYGARNYDPAIGRWMNIDPLSEQSTAWSPYRYAYDNPLSFIDPDGMWETEFKDEDGAVTKTVDDGSNAVFQETGKGVNKHYEFKGFDEKQKGENNVNVTSAIQEQQNMNNDNPSLQENAQGQGETHCNQATQNIMKTVGSVGKDPNAVVSGNANSMVTTLDKGTNSSYKEVDRATAESSAKNGELVVIGWKNPQGGHGHVLTFSVGDNIAKGQVANIGPKKYSGFVSLNGAISKTKPKTYYLYELPTKK